MGRNINTVTIVRKNYSSNEDIKMLKNIIDEVFTFEQKMSSTEFYKSENERTVLIIYFNEKLIFIDDDKHLLNDDYLPEISSALNSEVIRIVLGDTTGISEIKLFENGQLIRRKQIGLEEYADLMSEEELEQLKEIGEKTVYEKNGSDATSVEEAFLHGRYEYNPDLSVSLYVPRK